MIRSSPRYRMLALDIDGTIVGRDGRIRPRVAGAIARAAVAGIRPVLCTGRRYRRALPVALQLAIDAPIVCNSGALVKDPADHRTLWRADLDPSLMADLLRLLRDRGEPAVSIVDHGEHPPDFLVSARPTGRVLFDEYVERNGPFARVDPTWMERPEAGQHFHLFAVGAREEMVAVEEAVHEAMPGLLRTFVMHTSAYAGTMCELLRADAGKWAGVLHLAELWGIEPIEIAAVGDDVNDLPMIEGAGLGVAMGQAPAEVRAIADRVTAPFDEDGVAALIDEVLIP